MPTRSHSHVNPSPYIAIDSRKHVPPKSVRTRVGVGEQYFDHAAGRPLAARQSSPAIPQWQQSYDSQPLQRRARVRHPVMYVSPEPAAGDWDDQAKLHDSAVIYDRMHANDAPVDLPLQSKTKMYFVVGALVFGFITMIVTVFFSGVTGASGPELRKEQPVVAPSPTDPIRPIR